MSFVHVRTFQWLWKAVGENLDRYTGFPKLIGECGGKNYHATIYFVENTISMSCHRTDVFDQHVYKS